ncbi:unnamed protein product [Hermetia illucens]|uniref:Uncharacterized protein n=1 Tax=Hermetia illucens TaxID=343691 RepID=A0A7R8UN47_HERIL|nr:unnamed protein product [Hermetia illucens]
MELNLVVVAFSLYLLIRFSSGDVDLGDGVSMCLLNGFECKSSEICCSGCCDRPFLSPFNAITSRLIVYLE